MSFLYDSYTIRWFVLLPAAVTAKGWWDITAAPHGTTEGGWECEESIGPTELPDGRGDSEGRTEHCRGGETAVRTEWPPNRGRWVDPSGCHQGIAAISTDVS